jgi:hypothetical protein
MCNLINICMLWHCALECPTWSTCYYQVFASVPQIGMSTTQHLYTSWNVQPDQHLYASTLHVGMHNLINMLLSSFCFCAANWNVNYSTFVHFYTVIWNVQPDQHLYASTLHIGMHNLINMLLLSFCFCAVNWNVNYSMFLVLLWCELECAANQTFLELFAHQVFFHSSFLLLFPFLGSSWNDTSMFLW